MGVPGHYGRHTATLIFSKEWVGSAHPFSHLLVMLSEAKHLVFRDSSVAFGSLRMTKEKVPVVSEHL